MKKVYEKPMVEVLEFKLGNEIMDDSNVGVGGELDTSVSIDDAPDGF